MATLLPEGKQSFNNSAGSPLVGGKLYTYDAGTNTPRPTYQDAADTVPNTNPVVLDARGEATVFWNGSYKAVLKDASDVTIWTVDGVASTNALELFLATPNGSSAVGFIQSAAGAVATTVRTKLRETISVKDFGAVGDGVTDDTVALQAAITAARAQGGNSVKLYWNKGTYKITTTLVLGTNQYIDFDPGVIINLQPLVNLELTACFVASNQVNVIMEGNGATINGTRTGAVIEGNAAGFFLYGSDNILVRNFTINNMATDGITVTGDVTGSGPCTNVIIQGVVVNNSRRNGMSIISAKGMQVIGGNYNTSNGGPGGPWAGIDIEPNTDCFLEDVVLIGVNTSSNAGSGIQITPGALSATTGKRFDVTIVGGRSLFDGADTDNAGLWFVNGGAQTYRMYGQISVTNFSVDSPIGRGVSWRNWDADKCPRVICDGVTVFDPNYGAAASPNADRSGFVMYCDSTQATANIGNIVLRNCHAEDTKAVPRMPWGFCILADAGKQVKNVRIEDPTAVNQVAGTKVEVYTYAAQTASGMIDTDVVYTTPKVLSIAGTLDVSFMGGKRISASAASNFQLGLAANCKGLSYEFQTDPGIGSTSIVPQAGDTIKWYVDVPSVSLVIDEGSELKIRSMGGTEWRVDSITGRFRRAGMSAPSHVQWAGAAPVAGAWILGDRVFNVAPAVGQPKSWVCTVAGTPGTWVSEGNL